MASSSSSSTEKDPNLPLHTITFQSYQSTDDSYTSFIDECVAYLSASEHLGFSVLPAETGTLCDYFFIDLLNSKYSVLLVVAKFDLYVKAYRGGANNVWYFSDVDKKLVERIFSDLEEKLHFNSIGFTGRYSHLESGAKVSNRGSFPLGMCSFEKYVSKLFELVPKHDDRDTVLSKGSLTFIQMVSEAIRLPLLQKPLAATYDSNYSTYKPSDFDMECQKNWGEMSERVMGSRNEDDTFQPAIEFDCGDHFNQLNLDEEDDDGGNVIIDSVQQVKKVVRILKFYP